MDEAEDNVKRNGRSGGGEVGGGVDKTRTYGEAGGYAEGGIT